MKRKPEFFSIEHTINSYVFYESESDKHNRIYVPRTEDFLTFIDKLYDLLPMERRNSYTRRNKEMFKRYPWLFVKNRWDGGIDLWDKEGNFKLNWFDYHEGNWIEEQNPYLFFKWQEELSKEFKQNAPTHFYYYMIMDTKEKYWTLRWYDNGNTEEGYKIVDKYCKLFEKEFGWNNKK